MKRLLLISGLLIALISCNQVSNKSVTETLDINELAKAIKFDDSFESFYENLKKNFDVADDITKAKFHDVTYRDLFNYYKFLNDSAYWNPLLKEWEMEWEQVYGKYLTQADSVVDYWKNFLDENSLNKYVRIELAKIDVEYYTYSGAVKKVLLGFELTALQGTIQQVLFNYGYKPKINEGSSYYEKYKCILTSPFSSPITKYWEVDYSDRDFFVGKTVNSFLRDYDIYFEITGIRKNDINISKDDFTIPRQVKKYLENDNIFLSDIYKSDIIESLINAEYVESWKYKGNKAEEILEKKDKRCYSFFNQFFK